MRIYPVTKQLTLWTRLINTVVVALAVFLITLPAAKLIGHGDYSVPVLLLALAWFAYQVYVVNVEERAFDKRASELLAFAAANEAEYTPYAGRSGRDFALMSLADLGSQRDRNSRNQVSTKDWTYCDYSYAVYRKTKNGEYKAATVHYGVMTMKLPRSLPNVFFDSLSSRRRQFRFHFTRNQRHSLEGDFDRYFATYFPEEYTIDSLSFITPDVMLALRAAADYDIEIVGDRLFMYGPLDDPQSQIPDMVPKLAAIKQQLLDNILTYRDERLPFAEGRQRVHMLGANLKRSQLFKRLTLAGTVLYIVARIILETWAELD